MSKYMKELPSDPVSLKSIKGNIDEIVSALVEIDGCNELIASVKEVAQDKYGIDGGYLVNLAKLKYDEMYNDGKKAEKIRENSEMLETVENL